MNLHISILNLTLSSGFKAARLKESLLVVDVICCRAHSTNSALNGYLAIKRIGLVNPEGIG